MNKKLIYEDKIKYFEHIDSQTSEYSFWLCIVFFLIELFDNVLSEEEIERRCNSWVNRIVEPFKNWVDDWLNGWFWLDITTQDLNENEWNGK